METERRGTLKKKKKGLKLCNVISSFSNGAFLWLCNGAATNTYKQCSHFWSSISSKMCSSSSVNIWSEAWQPQFLILHWPWRMSLIPPPHPYFHHCRLHSPFYSQRRTAQTQLPVFTKLRAFLLFCLIKIKCICCPPRKKKKKEIHNSVQTQKCCLKRLPTNILINWNHRYLLLCDSFNHVYNLSWMTKSHSACTRLCLDCFMLNSTSWLNVCWVQKYTNASDLLGNLI